MATVSEVVAAQAAAISAAYAAAESKGATVPAVTSAANLAGTVMSIQAGSGGWIAQQFSKVFSFDEATGALAYSDTGTEISVDGVKSVGFGALGGLLASNNTVLSAEFPDLESAAGNGLYKLFHSCQNLVSVSFPKLSRISGSGAAITGPDSGEYGLASMCFVCPKLASVDLGYLGSRRDEDGNPCGTVFGTKALQEAFKQCSSLVSVDLSGIVEVRGNDVFQNAFNSSKALESVDLSNLRDLYGSGAFGGAFASCTKLKTIDLRGLQYPRNSAGTAPYNFKSALGTSFLSGLTALESVYFDADMKDYKPDDGHSSLAEDLVATNGFGYGAGYEDIIKYV